MTITTVALSTDRADRTGSVGGRTDGYYAAEINALHLVANRITAFLSGIDSGVGLAEYVRDTIGATIVAGSNITVTVNDASNTITIAAAGGGSSDPEFVRDTIGNTLISGSGVLLTVSDVSDTIAIAADPEYIRDTIGATLVAGANVSLTVNDASDTITINASAAQQAQALDVEAVLDTIAGSLRPGAEVDLIASDTGNTVTVSSSTHGYVKQLANGTWPNRPARPWVIWERTGSSTADPTGAQGALAGDIVIEPRTITAPSVATQPASQSATTGDRVTLSVIASGSTPLAYQWYLGSSGTTTSPVSGATGPAFTTPTLSANTNYWVRVTNAAGSADSNTAALTIAAAAPVITQQPGGSSIASGQTASLSVTASSSTSVTYQWYIGASGTTTSPISGATNASFTTPALTTTTTYWVRVTNSTGSADSNSATITVTPAPVAPTITANPQGSSISSGGTATLSVSASGTAPLSYQWYTGNSGATGSPIGGATSSSFTTPALTSTTSYWVRVTNSSGSADSTTATVSIAASLAVTLTDSGSTISSGDGLSSGTAWSIFNVSTDLLLNAAATLGGSGVSITAISATVFLADGSTNAGSEPQKLVVLDVTSTPRTVRFINNLYSGVFMMRLVFTVTGGQQLTLDRYVNAAANSLTWTQTKLSDGTTLTGGAGTGSPLIAPGDTVVLAATNARYGAATALTYISSANGVDPPSGSVTTSGATVRVNTANATTITSALRLAATFTTPYGSIIAREDQGNANPSVRRFVRFEPASVAPALVAGTPTGNAGSNSGRSGLSAAQAFFVGGGFSSNIVIPLTSTGGTVAITSMLVASSVDGGSTFGTEATISTGPSIGAAGAQYTTGISSDMIRLRINATAGGATATQLTVYIQDSDNS